MSQNLQNFVKFQKNQLENLVDFEKCCKTHILLQKSEPIQSKTSNILPKFCQPTLSDVSAARGLLDPGVVPVRLHRGHHGFHAVDVGEPGPYRMWGLYDSKGRGVFCMQPTKPFSSQLRQYLLNILDVFLQNTLPSGNHLGFATIPESSFQFSTKKSWFS